LFNPLPEQDLTHVFLLITQGLLAILGIFAVVFIIVGGVEMVVAAGNEEALAKAKKTIVWAVLGLVVALMSFSIIAIVEDLLQANIPSSATTPANPTTGTTPSNPTTGQTPGN
jgi:amino acid transporter